MAGSRAKRQPSQPASARRPRKGLLYRAGMRPRWHRVVGWGLIALGILVFVLYNLAFVGVKVLPSGDNDTYIFLGMAIAGLVGSWWAGLFDRP